MSAWAVGGVSFGVGGFVVVGLELVVLQHVENSILRVHSSWNISYEFLVEYCYVLYTCLSE